VAEVAVEEGRQRHARQALGLARTDARRVEVAGDDVDDLDRPHDGHHRGHQSKPSDRLAAGAAGGVVDHDGHATPPG
jgi:hypothetical protein